MGQAFYSFQCSIFFIIAFLFWVWCLSGWFINLPYDRPNKKFMKVKWVNTVILFICRKTYIHKNVSLKPNDSLFNWKVKPNDGPPKVYIEVLREDSPPREPSLPSVESTPPRHQPVRPAINPVRPAVDPLTPRSRRRMASTSPSRADGDTERVHTPRSRTRSRTPRTPRTRRREDTFLCRLGCDDRRHFASESGRNHHETYYCRLNEVLS